MHRFTIDDVADNATAMPGTTFCYFDVGLPDRITHGHAIVNATDLVDRDAYREHIVMVLNTMVEEDGTDRVIEALASADGLRIWPAP
jgi:hypothetical protein